MHVQERQARDAQVLEGVFVVSVRADRDAAVVVEVVVLAAEAVVDGGLASGTSGKTGFGNPRNVGITCWSVI